VIVFSFTFQAFKNLSKLVLVEVDCSPEKITSFGSLRGTLKHLEVHKCGIVYLSDILMTDGKSLADADVEIDVGLSQISVDDTNNSPQVKEVSYCLQ
jgi:hypothetical protein